jgi:phenylpyruvate tautomerase PptA (4-oxalocrotonate tautomerase family)
MPLLKLQLSTRLEEAQKASLLKDLSRLLSEGFGKPEQYVMVTLCEGAAMLMSGQPGPAAFADVRGIGGFGPGTNKALAAAICGCLAGKLGIPANRVYLNFTDVPAGNWGWDGDTFG